MAEYSIRVTDDTRQAVTAAIASFGDKITNRGEHMKYIRIETDEQTASELATRAGVNVKPVIHADFDMGMDKSVLRSLQRRSIFLRMADTSIRRRRLETVENINGQPAERYVARTNDPIAERKSQPILDLIQKCRGLRLYEPENKCLSVVFFDAADPQEAESIRAALPEGWTLSKIGKPDDPMP